VALLTRCLVVAVLLAVSGCHRAALLAEGPIEIGERPVVVTFAAPIAVTAPEWELCFNFTRQKDSQAADTIEATFITPSGERHSFAHAEWDRRGDSIVCHIGSVVSGAVFQAVELTAEKPLRLADLRGGNRS